VCLANFYSLKAHCFWLGITCYFLATWGQRLPGAARAQTPDPLIPSPMPWPLGHSEYNEKCRSLDYTKRNNQTIKFIIRNCKMTKFSFLVDIIVPLVIWVKGCKRLEWPHLPQSRRHSENTKEKVRGGQSSNENITTSTHGISSQHCPQY